MLDIPEQIKNLFRLDGIARNIRISFPNGEHRDLGNSDIVSESLQFTESLCSQENLKFGLCEAAVLEFETIGIGNIKGYVIDAEIDIDITGLDSDFVTEYGIISDDVPFAYYPVPLGRFTIDSCKRQADFKRRSVEAYSRFINKYNKNPVEDVKYNYPVLGDDEYDFAKFVCSNIYKGSNIPFPKETVGDDITWVVGGGGGVEDDCSLSIEISGLMVKNYDSSYDSSSVNHDMFGVFYTSFVDLKSVAKKIADRIREIKQQADFANMIENGILREIQPHLELPDPPGTYYIGNGFFNHYVVPIIDDNLVYAYPLAGTIYIPKKILSATYTLYEGGYLEDTYELITEPITLCGDDSSIYRIITPNVGYFDIKSKKNSLNGRYYLDIGSFPYEEIVSSYLELNGLFGKAGRDGLYSIINIQNSFGLYPSEDLYPSDGLYPNEPADIVSTYNYRSFWYEEYSVQPFGKVVVDYMDEEGNSQTYEYVFDSTARNVYYMSDNYIFQNTKMSQSKVKELLDTYFIPNIKGIEYVPVELEMKGLPYIEAGDVLNILTSSVGMETFVFRRTLSGIMSLKDSVEAQGDEVNEDVKDISEYV